MALIGLVVVPLVHFMTEKSRHERPLPASWTETPKKPRKTKHRETKRRETKLQRPSRWKPVA